MYKKCREIDPDILIIQGITGNISYRLCNSWAKRKGKLIIGWTCGFEPGIASGFLLKLKNSLVSSFFRKANYFLTYSSNSSKYVESLGVNKRIIETCYNGIETDDLYKNSDHVLKEARDIRAKYQLENDITYLYVGALIPEKKVDFLIESFLKIREKHKQIKLMIIGDGPLKSFVEESVAADASDSIIYLGRIYEGVDSYFAAADCFVLPGQGGLGLNQAMFWKKTCIVSSGADGTEDDLIMAGETGYRFVEHEQSSMMAAMEARITDAPKKVEEMSEAAHRIIAEKSNVNNMVKIFDDTINRLYN